MKYERIAGTNIDSSVLLFGTAELGGLHDEKESFELLDAYFEAGGNHLDSGLCYSVWRGGQGASERMIGKWLDARGLRDKVIVATKGVMPEAPDFVKSRMNKKCLESDIRESMRNLGTDHIEIYYVHRDDMTLPAEEIISMLHKYTDSGDIGYIACSNWRAERVAKANEYARSIGKPGFICVENLWNFAHMNPEKNESHLVIMNDDTEQIEAFRKLGVAIAPFTPLAWGYFDKILKNGEENLPEVTKKRYHNDISMKRAKRVGEVSKKLGCTPVQLNLAMFLNMDMQILPIVACKSREQLSGLLGSMDIPLDRQTIDHIING